MDLKTLPKAELHRHLECSLRLSTLRDLAQMAKIEVPVDPAEFKRKFLVTEPMTDLESVLNKFLVTQKVLSTTEILTRITFEVIEDAVAEGIRILELRYAPTFVQTGHENLSFEEIHRAILKGVALASHLPIAVGLICIIQRIYSAKESERVVDFAIEHKDSFVGLDLADNEIGFDCLPFAPLFQRAAKAGLKITVHAGESNFPGAPQSVRNAIDQLGAVRIGHGLQIIHSPAVMDYVKEKNIVLELCPTSNWLTNAVPSVGKHPFRHLFDYGIPVTINTDDPGVFDINLQNEYAVLREQFHFTEAEFNRCNDTAAAASFISLEKKQRVWPRAIISG